MLLVSGDTELSCFDNFTLRWGVTDKTEEERKSLKYQEKMNLDIENISSRSQKNWRSMYEVIHDDCFKAVKLFPTLSLDHYLKK